MSKLKELKDNLSNFQLHTQYVFFTNGREKNEQSFWKFVFSYPATATMPILYTPTAEEACQKRATYRTSYRRIYITPIIEQALKAF
jgi:hypothetical protein